MQEKTNSGFTLIELLTVVAILGVLTFSMVPMMGPLIDQNRKSSEINDLIGLINLARTSAITRQTSVTICPLDKNFSCSGDWNKEITVFIDPDRKRTLQSHSDILRQRPPSINGKLIVRSGIRNYFGFRSDGTAREAIGHLIWCPPNGNAAYAGQIRINMGGRPIVARKTNSENIVLDSKGKPISCS